MKEKNGAYNACLMLTSCSEQKERVNSEFRKRKWRKGL